MTEAKHPLPTAQQQAGLATQPLAAAWQAVAATDALPDGKPLGVTVLGMPVVLYRKADGAPVALADRCPHRWAPLSGGRVQGDHIVCPYHGFQFCPRGQLVQAAGSASAQGMDAARVYPVQEQGGQLWVWMGDGPPA